MGCSATEAAPPVFLFAPRVSPDGRWLLFSAGETIYVAPVESGEQVVALLYADNAATGRALGDTSALEVIAHEAGLALDRAVLERALERAEGERRSGSDAGEAS